jgi:hypothetical protein
MASTAAATKSNTTELGRSPAYLHALQSHIDNERRRIMAESMDKFSTNPIEGEHEGSISRIDGWDAEVFDEYLNKVFNDCEFRLNYYGSKDSSFEICVESDYNDISKDDGLHLTWNIKIYWDSDIPNPFEELANH